MFLESPQHHQIMHPTSVFLRNVEDGLIFLRWLVVQMMVLVKSFKELLYLDLVQAVKTN